MSPEDHNPEDDAPARTWWGMHSRELSSGMVSLVLHATVLLALALLVFPRERVHPRFDLIQTEVVNNPVPVTTENLKVQAPTLTEGDLNNLAALQFETTVVSEQPSLTEVDVSPEQLAAQIEAEAFLGREHTEGEFAGRTEQARAMFANAFGGNASTEAAVNSGLKWLAEHQQPDGSWHFDHRCERCDETCNSPGGLNNATVAATSLAMLAYLGAGNTHKSGKYQPQMERALRYMLQKHAAAEIPGDLRENPSENSSFYTQGLATIALCETYGMTGDRTILKPAQQSVNFIIDSQHAEAGGWRYRLGQEGDTSVVGWQVMALTSAGMSRIAIPTKPKTLAMRFLDSVQSENGALYGYTVPEKKASTTAIGLLCRQYLGWNMNRPGMDAGCRFLSAQGPSHDDMYYNYYATQVLHHKGGPMWIKWNDVMRAQLLSTQTREGHAAGSWPPRDRHGAGPGGRHYMTCLCVLTLEVYYRHLPLYQRKSTTGKEF